MKDMDISKYSLCDILDDTKHLDTSKTCEYISSFLTTMKWHYEKKEIKKITLNPLY